MERGLCCLFRNGKGVERGLLKAVAKLYLQNLDILTTGCSENNDMVGFISFENAVRPGVLLKSQDFVFATSSDLMLAYGNKFDQASVV